MDNERLPTTKPSSWFDKSGSRVFIAGVLAAASFYVALIIIVAPLMLLGILTIGILVWLVLFIATPIAVVVAVIVANIVGRRLLKQYAVPHATVITIISSLLPVAFGVFFYKVANTSEPGMPIILGVLSLLVPGALYVLLDKIFNRETRNWGLQAIGGVVGILVLVAFLLVIGILYHPTHRNDTRLVVKISDLSYTLYIPDANYPWQVFEINQYGKVAEMILVKNAQTRSVFVDEYQYEGQTRGSFPCYNQYSQSMTYSCTYLISANGMDFYRVYNNDPTNNMLVSYAVRKGNTMIVGAIDDSHNTPDEDKSIDFFKRLVPAIPSLLLQEIRHTQPSKY